MTAEEFYNENKDELNLPDGMYEHEIQTMMKWYADYVLSECHFIREVNFRNFTSQLVIAEHNNIKGYGETKMKALDDLINKILNSEQDE